MNRIAITPVRPLTAVSDPARTTPPRKPSGTGWERTASAPTVCPECGGIVLGTGHVCKPRLDAVSAAWLARYRRTARRLPHLDAEQLGARVEQHLTGVAA